MTLVLLIVFLDSSSLAYMIAVAFFTVAFAVVSPDRSSKALWGLLLTVDCLPILASIFLSSFTDTWTLYLILRIAFVIIVISIIVEVCLSSAWLYKDHLAP